MASIIFLSLEEVVSIHEDQIANYGGSVGLRDHFLLDAAISTPRQTFGGKYLHVGIPSMAAAYLFHLVMNHPFVDGNKRVGAAAASVFLRMNRFLLNCSEDEYCELTLGVAAGRIDRDQVVEFFRLHVKPVSEDR